MNTVHLFSFPLHIKTHTHARTHSEKKKGEQWEHKGLGAEECDSVSEGSDGEGGEGGGDEEEGCLFFQCTEGVLHVLHQLSVVGLDLGLAVLHRVLERHTHTVSHTQCE